MKTIKPTSAGFIICADPRGPAQAIWYSVFRADEKFRTSGRTSLSKSEYVILINS